MKYSLKAVGNLRGFRPPQKSVCGGFKGSFKKSEGAEFSFIFLIVLIEWIILYIVILLEVVILYII